MSLSQTIKDLRKSGNLTQAEFAKQFNISNGTIAMWETGKRHPDNETLIRIADYFNVSIDFLLGRPVPNLKFKDVLNILRGKKELTDFLKECDLNENEINAINKNPKLLEIKTLKKIFEHSNQEMPFEQLLFSAGKTYKDFECEFSKNSQTNPIILSERDRSILACINRADEVFGVEFINGLLSCLDLQTELTIKEKNKNHNISK